MLISYSFSNFRSFKGKATLSMVAGRQRTLSENLITQGGQRVLPSAVIYGANASGKSSIIMSLAIMKEIVLAGTLETVASDLSNLELYPFAHIDDESPMFFEVEFIHAGYHIVYSFEILCSRFTKGSRTIASETLSVVKHKTSRTKLFERNQDSVQIMKDSKALDYLELDEKLLAEFEKRINTNLDTAELFLPRAFKNIISSKLAETVIDFFKEKLVVVSDFTLKKANIRLSLDSVPRKNFLAWNRMLEGFVKSADFGPQNIAFKPRKPDGEDVADMELVSIYKFKNQNVMVAAELMESRGTLKLLDFAIPFGMSFDTGGVFVLDEFDATIHPELIKGIISLFNDQATNTNGAQLIFTTHNPIYLDRRIFRRDQIRFVEKDSTSFESVIYSLADFGSEEVRNDHNYLINYFKGNYGALPFIDFSKLVGAYVGKEDE